MKEKNSLPSREISVEIAALFGKHLLQLEHLHYGYWNNGLEVKFANLHLAQDKYVEFLMSNIPEGVKTILDVGCGMGRIAKDLVEAGYKVDCVSPSPMLAQQTRDLLRDGSEVFECYYEQLATEKRYDLVLFCESFQYIEPREGVKKSVELLKPDGYMLICDIFRVETTEKSPISGGHKIVKFFNTISENPLSLVKDIDITKETAPNIDIENSIMKNVFEPSLNLLEGLLDSRYPTLSKILKWKYKKKIEKKRDKYFGNHRTGENFKKFKSYRLLLFKKNGMTN